MTAPDFDKQASEERRDIVVAAGELGHKVDILSSQLTISREQIRQGKRNTNFLVIVVLFLIATVITLTITVVQGRHNADKLSDVVSGNKANSQCVSQWADAYTNRVNILTALSSIRTDALDTLVRTFTAPTKDATAAFNAALAAYLRASDSYAKAVKENPVPNSPEFDCK